MQRTASIASRLLLLLSMAFLGLLVAIAVPVILVVYSGFEELEQRQAQRDLQQVVDTLRSRLEALDMVAAGWAERDEVFRSTRGPDPRSDGGDIGIEGMHSAGLDLLLYLDPQGKVVWAGAFDSVRHRLVESDPFLKEGFPAGHPLLRPATSGEPLSGMLASNRGPLLLAARPVLAIPRTDSPRGVVVVGRLLTTERIATIARQLHLDLIMEPLTPGRLGYTAGGVHVAGAGHYLSVTGRYDDLFDAPLLKLEVRVPREITHRGKLAIGYALASVLVLGLLVLSVLYVLLHGAVVHPLRELSATIVRLGEGRDERAALPVVRRDELGVLARAVQRMYGKMEREAHCDGLTRLLRRDSLAEQVAIVLERLNRGSGEAALLFVDLDGFKAVNDRFGHSVGDRCLVQVAQRLRTHVRGYDLVGRLGGDEFVLVLEGIPGPDEAASVARKLIQALALPCGEKDEVQLTASIGISLYPRHGDDWEGLLAAADQAMYEAKQAGKNTYRFFRPGR